jgi:ABC-type lipoprotein export system ATPase subunit
MEELSDLNKRGNTIIMVTHNPRLTSYASRVITMIDGHVDTDTMILPELVEIAPKRPLGTTKKPKRKKRATKKKEPA